MIHELHDLLYRAGARLRSLRLWSSLALCWVFWATVVYLVARFAAPTSANWLAMWGVLGGATLLTALVCWQSARRAGSDPRAIARRIEAKHPELGAMLLAALEQAPSPRFKRLSYLQATVVRGAVNHGRQNNWADHTSRGRLFLAKTAHLVALAALASAALLLANRTQALGRSSAGVEAADNISGAPFEVTVEPGNAEIERGTTLLVIAKFKGPLPADADLLVDWEPATPPAAEAGSADEANAAASEPAADSPSERTRRMTRSLDDPQFVGRVPSVSRGLTYSVAFAGQRSPSYRVTVFEYPDLGRADAHLAYPAFARMEPKTIEDIRQVTAVEGTTLTLRMRLNKDVAVARLVDREGVELALQRAEGDEPIYEATYVLQQSQRFKLHLVDHQQRQNKLPPEIVVNVTPNKPPTIKFTKPGRDVRVSPIEELEVAAELNDDFGVTAYGLGYSFGGDEPTDVVLTPANSGDAASTVEKKTTLAHLLDFESMAAEPDQLLSYYVWVEDVGVDGQPRRTLSDMYFAEVRPFDEIFREGEQPTEQQQREQQQQQQGGAGQQAQELAELQKQIAAATWKLIRRETGETPSFEFSQDAAVLRDSQQQAIEMLGELRGEVRDEQSLEHIAQTQEAMDEALEALERAVDDEDLTALRPALSAEQRAYQALLKLRARESNVTQQQSGQSGTTSGAGSASQQQLQQLELSADENRYETQSRAASAAQENAQQLDEARQILNRLAELARRQQDLNERLRELQAALEAAQTPEEREELERQLKRLRDQQREILRDAEELDNDVQNSQNREQMQAEAEQLQETRSRVQEATEALEEGMVSQAVTEGARAERELSELRDDFRRRTADRFSEEMRELRDAAQQLDERQQQLEEQLREMNSGGQRSLRDTGPRQEFLDGMELQRRELADALERMRETVTEAEEPEPLLANQLYEAVQDATEAQIEQALDMARQIAEAGATSEAAEPLRQATGGVRQLREQIDAAAESVLGDETEALRRADERLRELEEALNREIDNAQDGEPGEEEGQAPGRRGARERSQPPSEAEQGEGEQSGDGENGEPSEQDGEQAGGSQRGGQAAEDADQQAGDGQGQRPGRRSGQPNGENGEPQEGEAAEEQPQPGESQQQGSQNGGDGEASESETNSGQGSAGGPRSGESADENQQGDEADGEPTENESPQTGDANGGARNTRGGRRDRLNDLGNLFGGGGPGGPEDPRGPITGEDFRAWSEGMREVEDMLDDPKLAAEAARIRDRAEQARVDYVRHSKTPDWNKMVEMVAEPLAELRAEIAAEIRRKESPDSLVPIDRDTAPADFAEAVRLYYQRLGSGE